MPPELAALPGPVWIALCYAVANVITLALFAYDKRASARGAGPAGRIRERTLHACTLASGGLGAFTGLAWLRHKSRHASFWLSAFFGFAAHTALWAWWLARETSR